MDYDQLIPFDTSKGGTTPNLCLDNVRRGYGVANKYGSAWEAWQNTEQHPSRDIPAGLAVPLYYSYTATIDGITKNYGHINVQLPNGTVWSDGNIYTSIDDYTLKKLPKFVGWGESINDAKVIQEGEYMTNDTITTLAYQVAFNRSPNAGELAAWAGKPVEDLLTSLLANNETQRSKAANFDNVQSQLTKLQDNSSKPTVAILKPGTYTVQ